MEYILLLILISIFFYGILLSNKRRKQLQRTQTNFLLQKKIHKERLDKLDHKFDDIDLIISDCKSDSKDVKEILCENKTEIR